MTEVVPLKKIEHEVNDDAIKLAEGLLERLRSGEAIACAFVEVKRAGWVATAYSKSNSYHHLLSGACRLQNRIASEPDD
jgi:hypothetical protein